jgi:fibronectin type 3 domain-containing protein
MPPRPLPARSRAAAARRLLASILVVLAAGGCGKKGPPRPPIRSLPLLARDVKARQIGDHVVVSALLPRDRADGSPLGADAAVRILRMTAAAGFQPGAVSPRYLMARFTKEAEVVASLTGPDLERAAPAGRLSHTDTPAMPAGSAPPIRYLYGIEVGDRPGKRGTVAMPVVVEVAAPPVAPVGLKLEAAEGEVRLAWEPGAPEVQGILYNVYRAMGDVTGVADRPLNATPLSAPSYVDRTFRYGETCVYTVRAALASETGVRESVPTAAAILTPRDVYPPRAPSGLAVAVEGRIIKVYWFPNDEADLGGYRIYRRQAGSGEFALLEVVEAAATAAVDATVLPGVRYDYRVTAIDRADPPNESPPSGAAGEIVPAEAMPMPPAAPGSTPE